MNTVIVMLVISHMLLTLINAINVHLVHTKPQLETKTVQRVNTQFVLMAFTLIIAVFKLQAPVSNALTGVSEIAKLLQFPDHNIVMCVVVVDMKSVIRPVLTVQPAHMNTLVRVASVQTVLLGSTLPLLLQRKSQCVCCARLVMTNLCQGGPSIAVEAVLVLVHIARIVLDTVEQLIMWDVIQRPKPQVRVSYARLVNTPDTTKA